MNLPQMTVFALALIVAAGGTIGYIVAGSVMSIAMGTLFGIALLATGYFISFHELVGYKVARGITALLILFFAYRYAVTYKFMPAGIMAALCLLALWIISKKIKQLSTGS